MIRIARLDDSDPQFDDRFAQLLAGNETLDPELGATVSAILNNVGTTVLPPWWTTPTDLTIVRSDPAIWRWLKQPCNKP